MPRLKKRKRSQINNLIFHFRTLGKELQTKPRQSTREEIIKVRVEMNEIKNRKPEKNP